MSPAAPANSFLQRLIGAVALDSAIYEEVDEDASATGQAFLVVLLSSLAAGIGSRGLGGTTVYGILFISALALIAWAAWALVVFEIGTRLIPEPQTQSSVGEVLRTLGFATAPGLLRVIGVISSATIPVFVITALWMLAAMIVAVRQALDFRSTVHAIAVCVLGWTLAIAIAVVIGLFLGRPLQ